MGYRPEQAARELLADEHLAAADLVLLQEVDEPATGLIAEQLGMHMAHVAAANHRRTGRPFGNAVLARSPLITVEEIPLPHTAAVSGQPRSALRASTSVAGRLVIAYSAHTEIPLLSLSKRTDQFRTIADDTRRNTRTEPVVVGGDFNTASRRALAALDDAMGARDLERATLDDPDTSTFTRWRRSMPLDHVYGRGVRSVRGGVIRDTTASDHYPVWVDFAFSQ